MRNRRAAKKRIYSVNEIRKSFGLVGWTNAVGNEPVVFTANGPVTMSKVPGIIAKQKRQEKRNG